MEKHIIFVVCDIFYYDTTPFVCLLDGEVLVSAKGAEALKFLFREVRVCGRVERQVLGVMYCSCLTLEDKSGVQSFEWVFEREWLLTDLENLSESDNTLFMLGILEVVMKPSL